MVIQGTADRAHPVRSNASGTPGRSDTTAARRYPGRILADSGPAVVLDPIRGNYRSLTKAAPSNDAGRRLQMTFTSPIQKQTAAVVLIAKTTSS